MKIIDIDERSCFSVETDEPENFHYTRFSADNWTVSMGESDEPLHDCEEMEKLFQDYVSYEV